MSLFNSDIAFLFPAAPAARDKISGSLIWARDWFIAASILLTALESPVLNAAALWSVKACILDVAWRFWPITFISFSLICYS